MPDHPKTETNNQVTFEESAARELAELEDDHFHEQPAPAWNGRQGPFSFARSLADNWLVLGLAGVVVILAVAIFWRLLTPRDDGLRMVARIETRLDALESRTNAVTGMQQQLDYIERELNALQTEPLLTRVNNLEKNVALRLDQLAVEIRETQQKLTTIRTPPPTAPAPASGPTARKPARHEVQPGETLFGISRRYGLSMEDLLRLNNLTQDSVIQPGQNLIVAP